MKAFFAIWVLTAALPGFLATPAEAGIVLKIKVPPKTHKVCTTAQGKTVCKWVRD